MSDRDLDAEFARIIAGWDDEAPDPLPRAATVDSTDGAGPADPVDAVDAVDGTPSALATEGEGAAQPEQPEQPEPAPDQAVSEKPRAVAAVLSVVPPTAVTKGEAAGNCTP